MDAEVLMTKVAELSATVAAMSKDVARNETTGNDLRRDLSQTALRIDTENSQQAQTLTLMVSTVDMLAESVKTLTEQVQSLMDSRSKAIGLLTAMSALGGGAGATLARMLGA